MTLCPAPVNTGYVFRIKKIMLEYHEAGSMIFKVNSALYSTLG